MSAVLQPRPSLQPMRLSHLAQVMHIESCCYSFPWTHGNFVDSLAAGYLAQVLVEPGGAVIAYLVAMCGVDEMHLLNITVAPECQGRGHATALLDALMAECRRLALAQVWLEVRRSNAHALGIYRRRGFVEVGLRRGYYPAPAGRREDAVVMRAPVGDAGPGHAVD